MGLERFELHQANASVIEEICNIINEAKADMRQQGRTQWQDGYPAAINIVEDIKAGIGYTLIDTLHNKVVGYSALILTGDIHYATIQGKWITSPDIPYAVIHRLAIAPTLKGNGLASHFMDLLEICAKESGAVSMRLDTNYDNGGMLRIMDKRNYQYTGIVTLPTGTRQAYEKML